MPGISFLFKKRFHPARTDNQKKLFIAEEKIKVKSLQENESKLIVMKEKEIVHYESISNSTSNDKMRGLDVDPRNSSLKFMYNIPKTNKKEMEIKNNNDEVDENGDDRMVRLFKAKLNGYSEDISREEHTKEFNTDPITAHDKNRIKNDNHRSALEKEVGKRSRHQLTYEEQEERYPQLKNAPTEGSYAKNMPVRHKPFNAIVNNVQCARCGEWGHRSGDRECRLKDHNPLDHTRQQREDPMNFYQNHNENESDPEEAFLATLTRREKKLLLKKLQEIEGPSSDIKPTKRSPNHHDDNSSSSSCSSSSNSDIGKKAKKRKSSHKHRKRHKHDKLKNSRIG